MTYIRTHLPEEKTFRKMIVEQGETTVFKKFKKYSIITGSCESVKIWNEILYKFSKSKIRQ